MASFESQRFTLAYDDGVVRDSARAFIRRRAFAEQRMMWVIAALMAAFSVYLLGTGGNDVFAAVLLLLAVAPFICVFTFQRMLITRTLKRHRRTAEVTVDADGIAVVSEIGEGQMLWRDVTEIWELPNAFMIFTDTTVFDTFPKAGMPDMVQAYLKARAAQMVVAQKA
ncbi:YcxB family protein [Neorhizobium sp. NPDC001467]|uniref:YcxB family protein n=1 Tax=Neorhizobium sp. NPDC001467 TaxID=3390595 RepID=UPI003CFFCD32